MSEPSDNRTRLLGLLVLLLGVVIVAPHLRSAGGDGDEPEKRSCPQEFPQTRMAATLLWNVPDVGYTETPATPVDSYHPDDLRLLQTATDGDICSRIHAAIPDTLKPLGILAPRLATFYELGELYVVPVEPSISMKQVDAEGRGETVIDRSGIVFVFDRELDVLAAVEN